MIRPAEIVTRILLVLLSPVLLMPQLQAHTGKVPLHVHADKRTNDIALDTRVQAFNAVFTDQLLAISPAIVDCLNRPDTTHAVFYGCVDWHSATHGLWALSRLDRVAPGAHQKLLAERLQPAGLAEAARYLREHPGFELPYGKAWLLRLAQEQPANVSLQVLADQAARSLLAYFRERPADPLTHEYDNASWALINLLDYVRFRGWQSQAVVIETWVHEQFAVTAPCPVGREQTDWAGFMSPCLSWAMLLAAVPVANLDTVLETLLPDFIEPVRSPRSAHHEGMNASRAWSFAFLYHQTSNPRWLEAYLDHLDATFERQERWLGDYELSHWVPQFVILALTMPLDASNAGASGDSGRQTNG